MIGRPWLAALAALSLASVPDEARALTFVSSSHSLHSFANAGIAPDSASLPGTDLTQFSNSVSTHDDDGVATSASNTTTLAYEVQPTRITISSLSESDADHSGSTARGGSTLTIEFSLDETADFVLDGVFQATGQVSAWQDSLADWLMEVRLEDGGGASVFEQTLRPFDPETGPLPPLLELGLAGTLEPDTYTLIVSNDGEARGHDFFYPFNSIDALAELTLTLPEPSTAWLLTLGLLVAVARSRP